MLMSDARRRALDGHLQSDNGRKMEAEYASAAVPVRPQAPSWTRFLRPPPVMHRYHTDLLQPPSGTLFEPKGGAGLRVLNVGGGPFRVTDDELTLNIGPFPGVDLIADAHDIPMADNSVDSVFSLAVLEHVAQPFQVVSEMIRVLRPGGILYSELPFIFFFHGYPTDYTRFTREGVRRLFSPLQELQVGMTHGPVSAVLQSANMVLDILLSNRPASFRKLANGAFRWIFFPLKYLDVLVRDYPDAHVLAGGFYALGRKPLQSVGA